jgi:hypothetical protein
MSILTPLLSNSVHQTARELSLAGISVVPAIGKAAATTWKSFQRKPATLWDIDQWYQGRLLKNIAIVCGPVSRNLVIMDCDGLDAVQEFEAAFPHYLNTLQVLSGSGNGKHYYYFTDKPMTIRSKGFELRGDGCYVIAPPSKHPISLSCYSVTHAVEPMTADLEDLRVWIARKQRAFLLSTRPARADYAVKHSSNIRNPSAYAKTALRKECDLVRLATEGSRNRALNSAALRLGNLVKLGWLDYHTVESELLSAAAHLSASDGEAATLKTIRSGLDAGIRLEQRGLG